MKGTTQVALRIDTRTEKGPFGDLLRIAQYGNIVSIANTKEEAVQRTVTRIETMALDLDKVFPTFVALGEYAAVVAKFEPHLEDGYGFIAWKLPEPPEATDDDPMPNVEPVLMDRDHGYLFCGFENFDEALQAAKDYLVSKCNSQGKRGGEEQ